MSVLQPGLCLSGYNLPEGEVSPWLLAERCISEAESPCPIGVPTWQGSLGQLEVAPGPGWTFICRYRMQSSANNRVFDRSPSGRSLINIRNRSGPNTEP